MYNDYREMWRSFSTNKGFVDYSILLLYKLCSIKKTDSLQERDDAMRDNPSQNINKQ